MTNLETLKKQTADLEAKLEESTAQLKEMKAEIEHLENGWEMKYPFKKEDEYWVIYDEGSVEIDFWGNDDIDEKRFNAGNAFLTEQAAVLEAKRRNLLTRFRAFRDECNGDWKADWKNHRDRKYFISFSEKIKLLLFYTGTSNHFQLFGFFKNEEDAQRAIDLFGDEIKELFV